LRLRAAGAAVSKLVTVVEVVKRSGHAGLTASFAVGDGSRSKPPPQPDCSDEANKRTRGMYGRKLEACPPAPTPAAADDGVASAGDVWMEATLCLATCTH
ncbi:hypothetical protein H4R19_005792, partial [Coemansia spiralis]